MKLYRGDRTIDGTVATVDGIALPLRLELKRLSAPGFEWGYEGSAPAQLALAILADHLADDAAALRLYEIFMREIVANFGNEWEMTSDDVAIAIGNIAPAN